MSRSAVLERPETVTRSIRSPVEIDCDALYPTKTREDISPKRGKAPFKAEGVEAHEFRGRVATHSYFSVDGVGILTLGTSNPNERAVEDVLRLVAEKGVRSVMIADTIPHDGIKKLVTSLHSRGVRVHFVDHHEEEIFADKHGTWGPIANHWALKNALGTRFITAGRNDAPSVSHLCPQGFARDKKIDLIIGGHPDIDFVGSALWFAGCDPGTLGNGTELPTPEYLGVIDSPNSVRSRAVRMGLLRIARRTHEIGQDEKEVPLPVWLDEAKELMNLRDPALRRDAQMALAAAVKEGNLAGEAGTTLHKLSLRLKWEEETIAKLIINYVDELGNRAGIFALDLDAILKNDDLPLAEVFTDKEEFQFIKELISDPEISLEKFSVVMKKSNRLPSDGVVLISKFDEFGRRTSLIEAFGKYRFRANEGEKQEVGMPAMDFREIGKAANVALRARIGHRAFFDGDQDERLIAKVAERMSLIDIATEKKNWTVRQGFPPSR